MTRLALVALLLTVVVQPAANAANIVRKGFIRGGVPDLPCTIQIDFGSAATGPDLTTFDIVRRYIADAKLIYEADAWGWGKEGEFSVCVKIDDPEPSRTILADLTKLVPSTPASNGGWTKVKPGPLLK
jgi:hypothetical protein